LPSGNSGCGDELVQILLDHDNDVQIGSRITDAAAVNEEKGAEALALLLEHAPKTDIPKSLLETEARSGNARGLETLLDRLGETKMTEDLQLLLEYDKDCPVTKPVIMAAIGNTNFLDCELRPLLARANISITEDMLRRAAVTDRDSRHFTKFLLEYQDGLEITEDLVEIAARNDRSTKEMFEFLLRWKTDVQIPERIAVAAAESSGETMEALLDCGKRIPITQTVLKALASNENRKTVTVVQLILHRQCNLDITKEVMEAAQGNKSIGANLIKLLRRHLSIIIESN
jgi:hypothetical protein